MVVQKVGTQLKEQCVGQPAYEVWQQISEGHHMLLGLAMLHIKGFQAPGGNLMLYRE